MLQAPQTALTDRIVMWIRSEGGPHALLLITVDGFLRPHIMMLARDEIVVMSATALRVADDRRRRFSADWVPWRTATLAIYDHDLACVIKTHTTQGPRTLLPDTVAYDLAVEEMRLDTPTAAEASARLVTGLRFEGRAENAKVRSLLENL